MELYTDAFKWINMELYTDSLKWINMDFYTDALKVNKYGVLYELS